MTPAGRVSASGITIHSGLKARVTLTRHAGPLTFRRAAVTIEANPLNVVSTDRTTVLGSNGARIALVEHLLAALRFAGFFSGVLVECDRDELPILDGSAQPWCDLLPALGEPPAAPEPLTVVAPFEVRRTHGRARVEPGEESLDCSIEFAHPAIGSQRWRGTPADYAELAAARTFGLLSEAQALRDRGLALGASVERAIVFADEGPLRPLRFTDEPVRHKALDALGDLTLLGRPLAANLIIERGSHALHHELMRSLLELDQAGQTAATGL